MDLSILTPKQVQFLLQFMPIQGSPSIPGPASSTSSGLLGTPDITHSIGDMSLTGQNLSLMPLNCGSGGLPVNPAGTNHAFAPTALSHIHQDAFQVTINSVDPFALLLNGLTHPVMTPLHHKSAIKKLVHEKSWVVMDIKLEMELYPEEQVKVVAKTYFQTLKQKWIGQENDVVASKQAAHKTNMRCYGRKHRKTTLQRAQKESFSVKYGWDDVEGFDHLLKSDWASSEHSDVGDADPEEWNQHHQVMGAGKDGLEVQPLHWHSKWSAEDEAKDNIGKSGSHKGKASYSRFPGLAVNGNDSAPSRTDRKLMRLFEGIVDQHWARRMGYNMSMKTHPAVESMSVLHLVFDTDIDLDAEAQGYLADEEAEEADDA
ncbi:hypothetical protein EDD85DRAFT_950255 [Armillaria nabsnona]|nr:hypothetical protein EDD85DRAFT_950255 [Armillaria nabsnona]